MVVGLLVCYGLNPDGGIYKTEKKLRFLTSVFSLLVASQFTLFCMKITQPDLPGLGVNKF